MEVVMLDAIITVIEALSDSASQGLGNLVSQKMNSGNDPQDISSPSHGTQHHYPQGNASVSHDWDGNFSDGVPNPDSSLLFSPHDHGFPDGKTEIDLNNKGNPEGQRIEPRQPEKSLIKEQTPVDRAESSEDINSPESGHISDQEINQNDRANIEQGNSMEQRLPEDEPQPFDRAKANHGDDFSMDPENKIELSPNDRADNAGQFEERFIDSRTVQLFSFKRKAHAIALLLWLIDPVKEKPGMWKAIRDREQIEQVSQKARAKDKSEQAGASGNDDEDDKNGKKKTKKEKGQKRARDKKRKNNKNKETTNITTNKKPSTGTFNPRVNNNKGFFNSIPKNVGRLAKGVGRLAGPLGHIYGAIEEGIQRSALEKPEILFYILDELGIDELTIELTQPSMINPLFSETSGYSARIKDGEIIFFETQTGKKVSREQVKRVLEQATKQVPFHFGEIKKT